MMEGEAMGHTILIIDDDADFAGSLGDLIQDEGYQVHLAANGREGLDKHRANRYGLIITDIIMPEKDGIEVIVGVRAHTPQTPLIAISGGGYIASHEYLLMARELGASVVLCKPFDFSVLRAEIKRLMG